ncbi:MAG: hypothetical protein ACXVA9_07125 [Bdellovibrionales bacterium]
MSKLLITTFLLTLTFAFSNMAFASGAVVYSCAGFQPNMSGSGPLSEQAVVFNMTSANNEVTIEVVRKSVDNVDPANSTFTVGGKDCKFTMDPDEKFPAYRVSVSGKCGTAVQQNFKGICFFDF